MQELHDINIVVVEKKKMRYKRKAKLKFKAKIRQKP